MRSARTYVVLVLLYIREPSPEKSFEVQKSATTFRRTGRLRTLPGVAEFYLHSGSPRRYCEHERPLVQV